MEELKIFSNDDFGTIRVLEVNNEPWFVGKDVAEILGYERPTKAVQDRVDKEDIDAVPIQDSIGRMQSTPIINESGLYSLILSSKLESAKKFKHWVTSEVLPSIRRNGAYMTPNTIENIVQNPDFGIELLKKLKSEMEERKRLETKVYEDKPKVLFADAVSSSKSSILIGDLAKILKQNNFDTGQKRLFETLRSEGYLIKGGSSKNMPTQKSMALGLFEVKETVVSNPDGSVRVTKTTKVTGKGQQYFINKFLDKTA